LKILFLTHYFYPEVNAPAARTLEHCRAWVDAGHEVVVVTCVPNHPKGKIYPGYKNALYQSEVKDGIKVYRLFTWVAPNAGFLKRVCNFLTYMFMSIFAAPFLPKADIVVSTSPQFFAGLAGYFVSRIKRARWVLEIRDLWPESAIAVGAIKNERLIRATEGLESFMYRKADAVVSVTDSFVAHIAARNVPESRIHVIKNGVDLAFYDPAVTRDAAAVDARLEGKYVAAYVGTHGMAHALHTALEAAALLKHREDIVFLMVGDGAEKERLVKLRDEMQLTNVIMLDQKPKDAMPAIWAVTDVSLVLLKNEELFKTVLPSKIVESMAMKRPIILGVRGEAQALVESAGAGICIEPENAEQLANAVVSLADNRDQAKIYGDKGRAFVEAQFDRRKLAGVMEKILLGLVGERVD
jgi:glycosyltransferase involved in cell wall biosynthesis